MSIFQMAGLFSRSSALDQLQRDREEEDKTPVTSMLEEAERRRAESAARLQQAEEKLAELQLRQAERQEQAIQGPKSWGQMTGKERALYALTEVLPKALSTFASSNPAATAASYISDMAALKEDAKRRREAATLERLEAEMGLAGRTVEAQRRAAMDAENDLGQRRWDAAKLETQEAGINQRHAETQAGADRRTAAQIAAADERMRANNSAAVQRLYTSEAFAQNREERRRVTTIAADFAKRASELGEDPMLAHDLAFRVATEGLDKLDETSQAKYNEILSKVGQSEQNRQAAQLMGALGRDIKTGTGYMSPSVGVAGRLDLYEAGGGAVTPEVRARVAQATGDMAAALSAEDRASLDKFATVNPDADPNTLAEMISSSVEGGLSDEERLTILNYYAQKFARAGRK